MKALMLFLTLFLLCSTQLFSNEKDSSLDGYISKYKKELFSYDYEKNEAESSKLRDSWIAPLRLDYSYTKRGEDATLREYQNAGIKMDQPIFASGGIIYGIKFADASKLYADYSIDVAKRKMIKDAVSILMQIKQTSLKEKKQHYQIQNSKINLLQKKEEYLNGQLDSGFLNNAVIQRNIVVQGLYDIQSSKEKLISRFEALSDMSYKDASIPHLELLTSEEFLKNNIVLKMTQSEILKNRYKKDVTVAQYLPRVNLTAGYTWDKAVDERDYYNYGFKVSIPLDINTFRDIESVRVDYLKSQVVKKDKQRELDALFEQVMHNIKNFDKKMALSDENIELYDELLKETQELYEAGYKTKYDVDTLKNSLEIQKIDLKIYEIDKQLELLTLYEMYVNDGK